ncbi:MAG: insulinase family protein [Verrucomicrobia bacterium]|nr:insulinase family protein [Verrucomicrobiota bacterium]
MFSIPRRARPLLFLLVALVARAALPFPHEASDLKPDPAVKFGTLPNGLRYAVRQNAEPKGRASLRLLVLAGSFHEQDDQRGLAHFLEHMAFNGSTHYPPGTLVEYLQRMGMSFGADTNANTGFDRTLYLLEMPKVDDATLTEGFKVLGDYAGGLLLKAEEIDKERGIIASEKRDSDSVEYRTQIAQFEFALGSTRLPARLPIGVPEVIEKAPRERFTDFWDTWYRPELMAIVAVGDFDPAAVEKMIAAGFADLQARGPARAEPSRGRVADFAGLRTHYHPEIEAAATSLSLTSITPYAFEPDTAARRIARLPRRLALSMLNRRLSVLAKKENAPFTSASVSVQEAFDLFREAGVDIDCKPEQWQAALAIGEQELRRALQHGFTAAELKEAAANLANGLDQAAKTAATRHHGGLANGLAGSLTSRGVFTAPADDLALLKPALDQVTPADCLAALRRDFSAQGRFLFVSGNVKIPGDARAAITAAYETSRAVKVEPPAAEAELKWAYTDFGPAGKVTQREHVADLDLTLVTFANGVRLNLKKTDFEANRIRLLARVGRGMLTQPPSQPGLANLAGGTFIAGGLGQHSADDLRRILAGKNVGSQFGTGQESFTFNGSTTRADLLLQLQLIAARLTDPGYRPEALRQARKGLEEAYLSYEHTLNGPLALDVSRLLVNGDPRFGMPPKDQMLARNLDEVRAWLTPELTRGKLEVSVVGDLDLDATIAAVAQTLGSLPPRANESVPDALKKVTFPVAPFAQEYRVDTEIPRGLVRTYWPTTDGIDIKRLRRFNLLGSVVSDRLRLKIREELGAAYSPDAGSIASDVFPGYGYILTHVEIEPAQAAKVADLLFAIGDDLAQNGVSDDELKRAREPILKSMEQSLRDNGYWLGSVLARAQEKPEVLDWSRTRLADVNSITAAELSALAKKYLGRPHASKVVILPKEKK